MKRFWIKVNNEDVLAIREQYQEGKRGRGLKAIAKKFGVDQKLISLIVKRKIWKHI